ncbi:MAG: hypothetical protein GX946_05515 [Oligosphaeraceae bacterium]|nr:hypothetical protein [Oligosphaeraceae bacterium]
MRTKFFRQMILALAFLFSGILLAQSSTQETADTVFVLPIHGPIDKGLLTVLRRAFRELHSLRPKALIIELDTPGGGLQETRELVDRLRAARKDGCEVYAFVKKDALSAGALLALSTQAIYMAESGIIGSAMPISISPLGGGIQELPADVKEKILSVVRAIVQGLAQENNHREELAIAMVDPQHPDLMDGDRLLCARGHLLNLTAKDAASLSEQDGRPLLAAGLAQNVDEMLLKLGLDDCKVRYFSEEKADRLARWITALGPLLLALGVLGLWIEFKTPGFGVLGFSGIALLCLYFFGHYIAGLAGLEEFALVLLGTILLAVEIFLIPGFGLTGTAGILCIIAGAGMAVIPKMPKVLPLAGVPPISYTGYLQSALLSLFVTILIVGLGVWLIAKYFPALPIYRRMVLQDGLTAGASMPATEDAENKLLPGQRGVCLTALHPSGIARINGKRVDVMSQGEYIEKGAEIQVLKVGAMAVLVQKI